MQPANPPVYGSETNAKPKGRPIQGSIFDDRIPRGPGCSRCPKLAPISSPFVSLPLPLTSGPQRAFARHRGIYRPMGDVASRSGPEQPPPDNCSRPRLDGASGGLRHPHRHDEFRPAIPRRGARQQCPLPLHRHVQLTTPFQKAHHKPDISTLPALGHFYFALTRVPLEHAGGCGVV
jgi:hypothetical protein